MAEKKLLVGGQGGQKQMTINKHDREMMRTGFASAFIYLVPNI